MLVHSWDKRVAGDHSTEVRIMTVFYRLERVSNALPVDEAS